ncbi:DUF805 domain-containing protein [Deinococcus navajonensis]|uniref:DUF805 domain-containing protein n=1 Tax=Deinococcus navajonensis TaxID=309884 RepID=A0ABV8XTW6_9DEIO
MNSPQDIWSRYWIPAMEQYDKLSGRTPVRNYWMFIALTWMIRFLLIVLFAYLDITVGRYDWQALLNIYGIFVLIPTVTMTVRRLHDAGRSGWYILGLLVPIYGFFVLSMLIQRGEPVANKWGPPPDEAPLQGA